MDTSAGKLSKFRIGTTEYVDAACLVRYYGVTRQTLWNWRRTGKIPPGFRYRNRVVFSLDEVRQIEVFVHHLVPSELTPSSNQLRLSLK